MADTTIIQSDVHRTVTQKIGATTWYTAELSKPEIPTGKRLVRWLAFSNDYLFGLCIGGRLQALDSLIIVVGDPSRNDADEERTFDIWWGAEVTDV